MNLLRSFIVVIATVFLAQPAIGQSDEIASLQALRLQDQRVLTIGHRLAVANANLCSDRAVATGIMLHSLGQYGSAYRPAARIAFDLHSRPAVLAVAEGGAAFHAGLQADDTIIAIDRQETANTTLSDKGSFADTDAATSLLETQLADGSAVLEVERDGARLSVELTSEQGCASRFQVVTGRAFSGKADGRYVQLTTNLVSRVTQDGELAAVLAHELAHNILEHKVRLSERGVSRGLLRYFGKNASRIKDTEIEADRLSVYLLDQAGYPPGAAEAFWRRFGPQHPWGPFGSPTHPGWRERADVLRAEVAQLERQKGTGIVPLPEFLQISQFPTPSEHRNSNPLVGPSDHRADLRYSAAKCCFLPSPMQ